MSQPPRAQQTKSTSHRLFVGRMRTVLPQIKLINTLRQACIKQACERYSTLDVVEIFGYCVEFGSLAFSIPIMRELEKLIIHASPAVVERGIITKYQYNQLERSLFTYRNEVADLVRSFVCQEVECNVQSLGMLMAFEIPPDLMHPEESMFASKIEFDPVNLCSILDELNSVLSGTIVTPDMPDCLIKLLVSYVVGLDVKHMDEIRAIGPERRL